MSKQIVFILFTLFLLSGCKASNISAKAGNLAVAATDVSIDPPIIVEKATISAKADVSQKKE